MGVSNVKFLILLFLHDFMLHIYYSLKIWFCTCHTGPIEHITNLLPVKKVNNENEWIMKNKKKVKEKYIINSLNCCCFLSFSSKNFPHEKIISPKLDCFTNSNGFSSYILYIYEIIIFL